MRWGVHGARLRNEDNKIIPQNPRYNADEGGAIDDREEGLLDGPTATTYSGPRIYGGELREACTGRLQEV